MNVACTACPAKYAVPDDRVRGKRARITCKHCGTAIIVDGTGLGSTSQPLKPEPGRQIRHTLVELPAPGSPSALSGSGPRSNPVSASRAPSPSLSGAGSRALATAQSLAPGKESQPGSNAGAWLVALPDGRREPASLARIVDLFSSGTLDDSTYVWREGMPEWKPPRSIPEIARALNVRQSAPSASSVPFPKPREYEEEEATRVAISPMEEAQRGAPSSRPQPPSSRGTNKAPTGSNSDAGPLSVARSTPPNSGKVSKAPPRKEPAAPLSSRPGEDIVARSRGVATLRKKSSPSAAPPPSPPSREPAPVAPPGRTPRRTLPPGAISIPLAGSDLMKRVPSPSTPTPPPIETVPVPPRPPSPPLRPAPEMEGPSRSAAPVAVPREPSQYEFPPRKSRNGWWLFGAAATLMLGVGGVGFATKWKFARTPPIPPEPTLAVATPTEPVPPPEATPVPSAAEAPTSTPSANRLQETNSARDPSPPLASDRSSASVSQRAARASSARRTKKSAVGESEPTETDPATAAEPSEKAASDAKEATDPSAPAEGPPFDRDAAATALGEAASLAQSCSKMGGPTGTASATVTFGTNGLVLGMSVGGEYTGTSVGACVAKFFRAAKVPAFGGQPVAVSKRFTIE